MSSRDARVRTHRRGGLKDRYLFSHSLELESPRPRFGQGWFPPRPVSWACAWPSSPCIQVRSSFSMCVCVLISYSSYKDTSQMDQGSSLRSASTSVTSLKNFSGDSDSKASAYNMGDLGSISGSGRSPGEGNGNPLQKSCWKIPGTEEPGRLQSMRSERVGYD